MSQLLKYLIVALLCLSLGAIVGILVYNHLSPAELVKNSLQTAGKVGNLAKDLPKAAQGGGDKKDDKKDGKSDKKESGKEGGDAKKDDAAKDKSAQKAEGDKKEDGKGDKKEEGKDKDDSTEYLRSLWPIKKRKPAEVSGETQGTLYLDGTSPYGPPSTYKEDLFAETKALTLPGDPSPRIPPPLRELEPTEPLSAPEPPLPPATLYQVEIGRFSSLAKAKEARNILRSKGHEVDVYYTGPITNPDWFYVRLSTFFSKPQAYQKAQTVAILEKIAPTIVGVSRDVKKLR